MSRVTLFWPEDPAIKALDPNAIADSLGLDIFSGHAAAAAVVCGPDWPFKSELNGLRHTPRVQTVDLPGLVGGGHASHRHKRARLAVAYAAGLAGQAAPPGEKGPAPALNVLVAGWGLSALAAAREISALGHPVLLATPQESLDVPGPYDDPQAVSRLAGQLVGGAETAWRTGLTDLRGAAGGFTARLKGPGGVWPERFGAVVLAPAGALRHDWQEWHLDPAWALPLEGLDPGSMRGEPGKWRQVALMAGLDPAGTSQGFDRALRAALALQKRPYVQVTLFFYEALVACEGGERRYRQAREAGVLMVRVPATGLSISSGGRLLSWVDPLLGEELELAPDFLAVEGTLFAPPPGFTEKALFWPSWSRLAPEHVRFTGGKSTRPGLYFLGALGGALDPKDRQAQAAAAAADLHHLLNEDNRVVPVINHGSCAQCLTCLRACPHGVLGFAGHRIIPAPAACTACGQCAALCPAHAIAPPGWSNAEITAGLARGLSAAEELKMVVFACSQSALPAFKRLSLEGHTWPAGLLLVPVICAGRVGQELIMKALSLGARRVLVAGCHPGNCGSLTGNLQAGRAVEKTGGLLKKIGLSSALVRFISLAANQPQPLARAVEELDG